ncbi:MAG: hypothetical protein JRJ87_16555 [Deltaproteobacteria bacterium]|nr:hypothetical protein [Deltaproteobacteria bacterium]
MNFTGFDEEDRQVFTKVTRFSRSSNVDVLKRYLADDVWSPSEPEIEKQTEQLCMKISYEMLYEFGCLEFAWFIGSIPRGSRGSFIDKISTEHMKQIRLAGKQTMEDTRVLASLQAILISAQNYGNDFIFVAGLHRLARTAADLNSAQINRITVCVPETSRGCFKAACFRLAKLEVARRDAQDLRKRILKGE